MSKVVDMQIDDLDAEILSVTVEKLNEYNARLMNLSKERDKYAGIVTRHLDRLATDKGLVTANFDFDIGTKSFVPKLVAEKDNIIPFPG